MLSDIRQRRAFTPIELIVVISIIALLIAILLPALGKAREFAKLTQYRVNLHQVGIGTIAYASNSKGFLPPQAPNGKPTYLNGYNIDGDWGSLHESMSDFVNMNLLQCPLAPQSLLSHAVNGWAPSSLRT